MRWVHVVLAWLAAFACWWLLVGSWQLWNLVWGAALAVLVAVAGLVVGALPGGRLRAAWIPELGSAAVQVLADFGILLAVLAAAVASGRRGPTGRFLVRSTELTGGEKATRRSWVVLVATWSPNAYVVDIDARSGRALVHDLRDRRRSEEPV